MNKMRLLAVPALAISAVALAGSPAMAADGSYSSTLGQLNGTTGTGTVTLDVVGDQATINLQVSGLAQTFQGAPYPHVQHIHGGATGTCPTPANDANGDGIVSVTESAPVYGGILATVTARRLNGGDPREALQAAYADDPFVQEGCSEYRYTAFIPVKRGKGIELDGVPLVE